MNPVFDVQKLTQPTVSEWSQQFRVIEYFYLAQCGNPLSAALDCHISDSYDIIEHVWKQ